MDNWALRSHELAVKATDEGRLPEEIVPVTVKSKKGETVVEIDEAPRRETSLEALAKLPPQFVKDGSHTAGNAPGVNDGAGALVVASDEWAKEQGRDAARADRRDGRGRRRLRLPRPHARERSLKALEKAGLKPEDIDLWEINEAFASVAINSVRMLGIDDDKVNVNGGAIALGHPIGASGARILTTLIYELRRRGGGLGCRGDLLRRRPGRRRDRRGQRLAETPYPYAVLDVFTERPLEGNQLAVVRDADGLDDDAHARVRARDPAFGDHLRAAGDARGRRLPQPDLHGRGRDPVRGPSRRWARRLRSRSRAASARRPTSSRPASGFSRSTCASTTTAATHRCSRSRPTFGPEVDARTCWRLSAS